MSASQRPGAKRRQRRRRLTPWRRTHWLIKAYRITFYCVIALLLAVLSILAVNDIVTADDPVYRGTFTFTHCVDTGRPRQCSLHGNWVSDDGRIRRTDVVLDGVLGESGQAESLYKPTSYGSDTVHTPDMWRLGPFVPYIFAAGLLVWAGIQTQRWRRHDAGRNPDDARDRGDPSTSASG